MSLPTFEEQRKFYEVWWEHNKRLSIDEKCRKRFVLSAMATISQQGQKRLRILDVGCGRGWMTSELAKYGEVLGVDFFVAEAQKRYPNIRFQEMNIVSEFPSGTYDVVVSSEVIEHLPRKKQAAHIQHVAHALGKNGFLVLTTPNKPQLEKLAKKLSDTSHMQPLENWLGKEELKGTVEPYFTIERFGSARFYPAFLFSSILLRAPYHVAYDYFGIYRFVDKALGDTNWGTYFTLVGKKRGVS